MGSKSALHCSCDEGGNNDQEGVQRFSCTCWSMKIAAIKAAAVTSSAVICSGYYYFLCYIMSRICLAFGLLVSLKWSICQECERKYILEPGQFVDSPLTCNIIGKSVILKCEISGMQFKIFWFFNKTEPNSDLKGRKLTDGPNFQIISLTGDTTKSTLTISSFNPAIHSGFYWCKMLEVTLATNNAINPSQVVSITAPFTSDQLENCSRPSFDFFVNSTRCALGALASINRAIGVEYTNISTTTTPAPPTTDATTIITDATTIITDASTVIGPEITTSSSSGSVARTAIIWFSVGAVALVLIVVVIILCAVAISRY